MLADLIKQDFPQVKLLKGDEYPDLVIILGGDGSILEAVQKYQPLGAKFMGLNLGTVGFLTAVRDYRHFSKAIKAAIAGKLKIQKRMLLHAEVMRKGKKIFSGVALNELLIQNLLGMVDLEILQDGKLLLTCWGTGLLVATPTGSTAYNLSAHGPILYPELECMIITKLLDHSIPIPSILVEADKQLTVKIKSFRKTDRLILAEDNKTIDVIVSLDAQSNISAEPGDSITLKKNKTPSEFLVYDDDNFLKSLREQFSIS